MNKQLWQGLRNHKFAKVQTLSVANRNASALHTVTPFAFISVTKVVAASSNPPTAEQASSRSTMSPRRFWSQLSAKCRTDQFTQCDFASPQHMTLLCFCMSATKPLSTFEVGSSGIGTSEASALY